jgi:hypothetical protein
MDQQTFEVGDTVYLTRLKHFGTIVAVRYQKPFKQPQAAAVRSYNIKLDDGATLLDVCRDIERTPVSRGAAQA